MAKVKEAKNIWLDGKLIPWNEANIHILSHSLHYGNAVFEGVRAYQTKKGLAVFRLAEHTKRLLDSAKACLINVPYSYDELFKAQVELLKSNDFKDTVYLRPIVFLGYGSMGVSHLGSPVQVALAAWEWCLYG